MLMINETTVRGAWVWMAACLLLLGLGTAGCGSARLWQKPYTNPETADGENPFVRVTIP